MSPMNDKQLRTYILVMGMLAAIIWISILLQLAKCVVQHWR